MQCYTFIRTWLQLRKNGCSNPAATAAARSFAYPPLAADEDAAAAAAAAGAGAAAGLGSGLQEEQQQPLPRRSRWKQLLLLCWRLPLLRYLCYSLSIATWILIPLSFNHYTVDVLLALMFGFLWWVAYHLILTIELVNKSSKTAAAAAAAAAAANAADNDTKMLQEQPHQRSGCCCCQQRRHQAAAAAAAAATSAAPLENNNPINNLAHPVQPVVAAAEGEASAATAVLNISNSIQRDTAQETGSSLEELQHDAAAAAAAAAADSPPDRAIMCWKNEENGGSSSSSRGVAGHTGNSPKGFCCSCGSSCCCCCCRCCCYPGDFSAFNLHWVLEFPILQPFSWCIRKLEGI
ncbi:hypothetical protein, conserved [Eimeria acervulina]|uniref:Sphingomyelin synthase-like domain-containing protein n=1 Tax=Eimeria acervulina TaxID=5801 RepID=U6GB82_EIMAC|nr:hypothetical protein, conserved [Eimeria acervulina]CDI76573.1 hypothetical protein, conserved [Eimeria acervulina]